MELNLLGLIVQGTNLKCFMVFTFNRFLVVYICWFLLYYMRVKMAFGLWNVAECYYSS